VIEKGHRWSALGSSYGIIEKVHGTIDSGLIVTMNTAEEALAKYKLKKILMMASIPQELLAMDSPMHGLKVLEIFWKSMPDKLKIPREI